MQNHVAAALLGLCLTAGGASASAELASLSAGKDAFSTHQHSPAFLGFMSKHDKKYCDGDKACEVSVLRENIFNLNQAFVDAHNSNPGASPPEPNRYSTRDAERQSGQHPSEKTTRATSRSPFPRLASPRRDVAARAR
jgi:hypothetical protein